MLPLRTLLTDLIFTKKWLNVDTLLRTNKWVTKKTGQKPQWRTTQSECNKWACVWNDADFWQPAPIIWASDETSDQSGIDHETNEEHTRSGFWRDGLCRLFSPQRTS